MRTDTSLPRRAQTEKDQWHIHYGFFQVAIELFRA